MYVQINAQIRVIAKTKLDAHAMLVGLRMIVLEKLNAEMTVIKMVYVIAMLNVDAILVGMVILVVV
jgi:hypothetical protein